MDETDQFVMVLQAVVVLLREMAEANDLEHRWELRKQVVQRLSDLMRCARDIESDAVFEQMIAAMTRH